MKTYDVVIAGAGIAGCVAARDLARNGHSVALLEAGRARELGHDWWDSVELAGFDEANVPRPKGEEIKKPYNFKLLSGDGDTGRTAEMPPEIINVDRLLLAKRLIADARDAGVNLFERARVKGPLANGREVTGCVAETQSGPKKFDARITIDATGVDSPLRRNLPAHWDFERRLQRQDFVIVHRDIRENLDPHGRSTLLLGPHGGVQWLSRDEGDLVDIVAVVIDFPGRINPKELIRSMIKSEGGVGELVRAGKSGRIPVRRALDSFVAPGFMVAGDSASMPNPINGSGVASAMRAASFAAAAAHNALRRGRTGVADLWDYNVNYKRSQDAKFAKLQLLQKLLFSETPGNIHAFLSAGFIPHGKFWSPEEVLRPAAAITRVHKAVHLLNRPDFLLRMTGLFALTAVIEAHYENFPAKYDQSSFDIWRMHNRFLFDLAPARAK